MRKCKGWRLRENPTHCTCNRTRKATIHTNARAHVHARTHAHTHTHLRVRRIAVIEQPLESKNRFLPTIHCPLISKGCGAQHPQQLACKRPQRRDSAVTVHRERFGVLYRGREKSKRGPRDTTRSVDRSTVVVAVPTLPPRQRVGRAKPPVVAHSAIKHKTHLSNDFGLESGVLQRGSQWHPSIEPVRIPLVLRWVGTHVNTAVSDRVLTRVCTECKGAVKMHCRHIGRAGDGASASSTCFRSKLKK
jgi:hypothetical protein